MVGSTLVLLALLQAPDSWTSAPGPNPGVANLASSAAKGSLWIYGGRRQPGSDDRHTLREFDPVLGQWFDRASIPVADTGYFNPCGAALGAFLYQFGGVERTWDGSAWIAGLFTNHVWRYSVDDDLWVRVADLPIPLNLSKAASTADRLVVAGGRTYDAAGTAVTSAAVFSYDPASDAWSTLPDLPVPTHSHHIGCVEGAIFVAGGNITGTQTAATWKLAMGNLPLGWVRVADLPSARQSCGFAVAGGRFYVTGGTGVASGQTHIEYSPAADLWTARTSPGMTVYLGFAGTLDEGGREFVYAGGGTLATYTMMKYALPDFGSVPTIAGAVEVLDASGTPVPEGTGFGSGITLTLSAPVDDADATDTIRLQAQISTDPSAFPDGDWVTGAAVPAGGTAQAAIPVPGGGDWFVRVRAVDSTGNPGAWALFGDPALADFYVDATFPTAPQPLSPVSTDYGVTDKGGGVVSFAWTASTDDRPGVTYRLEVSRGPAFSPLVASQNSTVPSAAVWLSPGSQPYYWRAVAIDASGNATAGPSAEFRVVKLDGEKEKSAGCGASARAGGRVALLAAVMGIFILGFMNLWKVRRTAL